MAKIIIMPRTRLSWHSQLCDDIELSHVAVRVGLKIGAYFNNKTGKTYVGYDRLASELGLGRSTVAAAIKELKHRGHLDVHSGGGRHIANEYGMILKIVQNVGRFDTETVQDRPENRPGFRTTTLKLPSEANSTAGSITERAAKASPPEAANGSRSGQALFKIGSDNWKAWIAYYEAVRNRTRVSFMLAAAERSRYGEWSEASEWPPAAKHHLKPIARPAK